LHPKNKKHFPILGIAQDEGLICFADLLAKEINIIVLSVLIRVKFSFPEVLKI